MEPIGGPAAALLRQLAETDIAADQIAGEIERIRTTGQDPREARRAALNERVQNEAGGILGRLRIKPAAGIWTRRTGRRTSLGPLRGSETATSNTDFACPSPKLRPSPSD